MKKYIARISTNVEKYYIKLDHFELFVPGSDYEYEHVNLELQRGKARKVI